MSQFAAPQPAGVEVEVLSTTAQFDALGESWEALARAVDAEAWMGYIWPRTWWEHFGAERALRLLALRFTRADSSLCGMLALYGEQRWGWRQWALLGHESQPRSPLSRHISGAAFYAAVAHTLAGRRDWDRIDFKTLPTKAADALHTAFATVGLGVRRCPPQLHRYIPLARSWPEVEAGFKPSLARNVANRERALRRLGPLEFEILADAASIDAHFEACLAIEASGWKGAHGTAMVSDAPLARFYRSVALRLAGHGGMRLYLLRSSGQIIAFQFNLVSPRGLAGLKTAYLDSWRRFAPGMVLLMMTLRHAHSAGMGEVDLLGNDAAYKADWTRHARAVVDVQVFNRTLRGRCLHRAFHHGHALKEWLRPSAGGLLPNPVAF